MDEQVDLEPVRAWLERWLWARERKAELEAIEKEARGQIEQHLGDAETGVLDGRPVITWKWSVPKNGRVDVRMLREQFPDVAAVCTTKNPARTFRRVEDS